MRQGGDAESVTLNRTINSNSGADWCFVKWDTG